MEDQLVNVLSQILQKYTGSGYEDLEAKESHGLDEIMDGLIEDLAHTFSVSLNYDTVGSSVSDLLAAVRHQWDGKTLEFVHEGKWYDRASSPRPRSSGLDVRSNV